jgi:Homeodomain-like domain
MCCEHTFATMHPSDTVRTALALAAAGLTDVEIGRRLGIPRRTVSHWRHGRTPGLRSPRSDPCPQCPDPDGFKADSGYEYAYLLGQYLGDGCVFPNSTKLRASHLNRRGVHGDHLGMLSRNRKAQPAPPNSPVPLDQAAGQRVVVLEALAVRATSPRAGAQARA